MKTKITVLILYIISLVGFASAQNKDYIRVVENLVEGESGSDYLLYVSDTYCAYNDSVKLWSSVIYSPYNRSMLFFIDDVPGANWEHPCRYIFIDLDNRNNITIIDATTPPVELNKFRLLSTVDIPQGEKYSISLFEDKKAESDALKQARAPIDGTDPTYGKKYAVIISGGANKYSNHERYWNDCSAIYSTLRYAYDFAEEEIFVLMSDGTDPAADMVKINGSIVNSPPDLDGNGTVDINGPATKSQITALFNTLSSWIKPEDFLYVFTTDHGGRNGSMSTLWLWNDVELRADEFAREINKIQAKKISIVMEQCYSGGFISHLAGSGRVIATACSPEELSYAASGLLYNEFVYHWTAAVLGRYPNGTLVNADYNGDGFVSMDEAFRYSELKDVKNETPQYRSTPLSVGQQLTLFGFDVNSYQQNVTVNASQQQNLYAHNIFAAGSNTSFTAKNGSKVNFKAGNRIELHPGFKAEEGSKFNAFVRTFEFPVFRISSIISENIHIEPEINMVTGNTELSSDDIIIYPNPGNGVFYCIDKNNKTTGISLYAAGTQLLLKENIESDRWVINIKDQPAGIYFLNIHTDDEAVTVKLIKQ